MKEEAISIERKNLDIGLFLSVYFEGHKIIFESIRDLCKMYDILFASVGVGGVECVDYEDEIFTDDITFLCIDRCSAGC